MKFFTILLILVATNCYAKSTFSSALGGQISFDDDASGVMTPRMNQAGGQSVALARLNYVQITVMPTGYRRLITTTSDDVNHMYLYDGSGLDVAIALGAQGSEVDKLYIPASVGFQKYDLYIPAGSNVSVRPLNGIANTGGINMSLFK